MLKIYNTLTGQKEEFKPLEEGKIRMYVCGITTYDYCHIGHARVMVGFDIIVRYLRARGYAVEYVRNITDIDDKIINRANENGEVYTDLTDRFIQAMHDDERKLKVLEPDQEPRATAYIDEIIAMVQTLVDKGFAYAADNGDVYYAVEKFAEYGKLSNKKLEDLLEGVRVNVEQAKQDPRDFALWKSAKAGEVSWESPWGAGRPGWHIECSAMSTCCLGNHFDIHGGGPDLVFPHHENEIAQSEAATGEKYANTWMHAGAVRVDNEKMSKSLGNFFTIREVLEKYHPEVVRYFLMSSHYRSPINYSEDSLLEARTGLERIYTSLRDYEAADAASSCVLSESDYYPRFTAAMDDDFNTREALAVIFELVRELNSSKGQLAKCDDFAALIKGFGAVLGILEEEADSFLKSGGQQANADSLSDADIDALVQERDTAKQNKDYARSDEIRDQLKELGIALEDSATGTQWRRA